MTRPLQPPPSVPIWRSDERVREELPAAGPTVADAWRELREGAE